MVETQGKGTLHAHGLIWLEGHLSPQSLRDRLAESDVFKAKMIGWLENTIRCELMDPECNTLSRTAKKPKQIVGDPHPGTIPAPVLVPGDVNFEREFAKFVDQLLREYNWHMHQSSCWKYLRRGESMTDENCRMGMTGETNPETVVDPETFVISLRRLHPHIANYNDLVVFLLKCNMDIKFVGSGQAAKAFLYYITDYITKPPLPLHVGLAALIHAVSVANTKFPGLSEPAESGQDNYVGAITSTVNSMMAHQEISHPQVLSYLIGGGDHYTSDIFTVLWWGVVRRYVDSFFQRTDLPRVEVESVD
ncbi:hypothetical protein C8F04DRAFT_948371, partial [Mycena alexandri]